MTARYQLLIATEVIRQDEKNTAGTPLENKLWDGEIAIHNLLEEDVKIAQNTLTELVRILQERVSRRNGV